MSVSQLTELISPAFTEKTIFEILNKKQLSEINNYEISIENSSSRKGDSYLSTIYRFVIKATGTNFGGQTETISVPVLVKSFPKNIARQKTFRSPDFFKTEIYFYERIWPEMKKIRSSKIIDGLDDIPLYLAGHCDGKHDFVALEDLSYQGFKPCGRDDGLSKENLSVFIETLANFHALGIVTREQNPDFVDVASKMEESYFADRLRPWYVNFLYKSMGPHYLKATKAVLPQEYHDKISKLFSTDVYGEYVKCCTIRDKLCSITQGDAWLPNFLVNNEDEGKCAIVLIDFQLARYAPVVNDLLQFFYTCIPNQLLLQHWDDFVAEYHQYLSARIEKLGGQKNYITLKELNDEFQRYPLLGLGMAMESTLMSLLTDNEVADIDLMEGENAYPLEVIWKLPEFDRSRNERLAFLVKHFVDKGFI